MMLGAPTDAAWAKLLTAMGDPESLHDSRFATNPDRCAHQEPLRDALEEILQAQPTCYWLPKLEGAGLPCAPINTVDQVMTDPQVLANDMVVPSTDENGRQVRLAGLPFKLSHTPGKPGAAPPRPGQHNREILTEVLGLSDLEVAGLAEKGVLSPFWLGGYAAFAMAHLVSRGKIRAHPAAAR